MVLWQLDPVLTVRALASPRAVVTEPETDAMAEPHQNPVGPGWIPALTDPGPVPRWLNGRSFPAVWRDTLPFTMGGIMASKDHPQLRLGGSWNAEPEPGSDEDVDQAIKAKIHIGLRTGTVLACAQLVVVDPRDAAYIPDWGDVDEATRYAADARLPASPIYIDLEAAEGEPLAWEAETWPLHSIYEALCAGCSMVYLISSPSAASAASIPGGTDYQAWARWVCSG